MDIFEFINQQSLILIPALWVIGFIIKRIEIIPNKFIPLILLGISVCISMFYLGFNASAFIQAVLVAGAAVGCNELCKQTFIESTKTETNQQQADALLPDSEK